MKINGKNGKIEIIPIVLKQSLWDYEICICHGDTGDSIPFQFEYESCIFIEFLTDSISASLLSCAIPFLFEPNVALYLSNLKSRLNQNNFYFSCHFAHIELPVRSRRKYAKSTTDNKWKKITTKIEQQRRKAMRCGKKTHSRAQMNINLFWNEWKFSYYSTLANRFDRQTTFDTITPEMFVIKIIPRVQCLSMFTFRFENFSGWNETSHCSA